METKNQNNNGQNPDNEKTVYSSQVNSEKTTISNEKDKTKVEDFSQDVNQENVTPKSEKEDNTQGTDNLRDLKNKKEGEKVSIGAFAAGMAGAAAAGVAAGTVFSEEITDFVDGIFTDENGDNGDPIPEVQGSPVSSPEGTTTPVGEGATMAPPVVNNPATEPIAGELQTDEGSSLHFSINDGEGNAFNVTVHDINEDGIVDGLEADVQLVDGSSISYTQFGDSLNPIFTEPLDIASPEDYIGLFQEAVQVEPILEPIDNTVENTYQIQPGDTLSEIAEANHTTVEHLMELNPDISDPDLIYAYHSINLPGSESQIIEQYVAEPLNDEVIPPLVDNNTPELGFGPVDWASFNDEPATYEDSEYGHELEQIDFQDYTTPESYFGDGFNALNNDTISAEFC
ncbi:MAG: LysM peptidoglycan-binding domain-containing protein [Prolixibacteraceae bacterium]|nr:LysM peptidoglycan-binding domain-containing protein [Prolixibacteraceae bacterium]